MPYSLEPGAEFAKCPCCGQHHADGLDNIMELFGFRDMGDGRRIPQSYCRACRIAGCTAGSPCKVKDKQRLSTTDDAQE